MTPRTLTWAECVALWVGWGGVSLDRAKPHSRQLRLSGTDRIPPPYVFAYRDGFREVLRIVIRRGASGTVIPATTGTILGEHVGEYVDGPITAETLEEMAEMCGLPMTADRDQGWNCRCVIALWPGPGPDPVDQYAEQHAGYTARLDDFMAGRT